ncbi:MAG: hypothetical protein KatS3mg131_2900 [Candidatus Tectimicrobiota bacterium]|nr:MAG: hypothetical protein KatS3mg131_2900 [Candidatus Tectomicrobia bacterium]
MQGLENGIVLAVNGNDSAPPWPLGPHHQVASHHQRLFVGQGHVDSRFHGAQGGQKPDRSHHRRHHEVHPRTGGGTAKAFEAGVNGHLQAAQPPLQQGGFFLVVQDGQARAEVAHLLLEEVDVGVCRQRHHREAVGVGGDDVQGVDADRTGRAEDGETFSGTHTLSSPGYAPCSL